MNATSRISKKMNRVKINRKQIFKLTFNIILLSYVFWLVQCSSSNWPVTLSKTLKNTLYQGFVFGWDSKCADPIKCEGEPQNGLFGNNPAK
jgi:hypothetical protein